MNKILRFAVGWILFLMCASVLAYDTEINGLRYDWVSYYNASKTAGDVNLVGYSDSNHPENLVIPCYVKWNEWKKGREGRSCQVCEVGKNAFENCAFLKSVDFSCVQSVNSNAFKNCTSLQTIYFSNTIIGIHSTSFEGCSSISEIHIDKNTPPSIYDKNAFDAAIYQKCIVYVPKGYVETYKNAEVWKDFTDIREEGSTNSFSVVINSSGNGSVSCGDNLIRNATKTYAYEKGTKIVLKFTPDNGYKISSILSNGTECVGNYSDLTKEQIGNISSIAKDYTVSVKFEAIPVTTHTLSIKASGNGSASYDGTTIRSKTTSFTVNNGSSATISFTPDNGYRVKSVKVDNSTVSINNNKYTISSINKDTSLEVEFEAIPTTTFSVSIESSGNGSVSCGDNVIRNEKKSYNYDEGTKVVLKFKPDNGYKISSILSNGIECVGNYSDLTKEQIGNISSIAKDYIVSVKFEAIPVKTHTLSIKSSGNGSASYDGTTIRSKTTSFTVNDGTDASISFSPDNGYKIKSLKLNNSDVTSSISGNKYTISNISNDTSVEVEFIEESPAIDITNYITAVNTSASVTQTNDLINSGSKLVWRFYNNSTENVTLNTLHLIDGQTDVIQNKNTVSRVVEAGSYVEYTTTISSSGIHTPVTCRFSYTYNGSLYSVDAIYKGIPNYTLSIKSTGNGSASYDGTTIRGKTSTFTVNEGTSATISFSPDNGYRIKSVIVNSSDVTSNVSNNKYTISSISKNTSVEVEFEAIPPTTYTLSIKSTGSGSVSYDGTTIRGKTSTFTVNEGTSATISFSPDNGYRIKSVIVNSSDVTSSVSSNKYTISSISKNTSVEVEFETIPPTTYTLSIYSTGSGYASYDGTTIRSKTSTFTVNEGTNATISFSADNGYRIKSVKVNSTNVTSSVSNNQYTVSNIQSNTTVEVEFEAIPVTTYTLSISSTGSGYASYDGTTIRSKTSTFTVNEGTNATISFSADNGYRIKSVKVNSTNVTSSVSNNQYTVSNIQANTTVEVEFEAIPLTTYTLTISSTGSGYASYDGTTIRSKTSTFTVNEGTNATISFSADNGYRIKSVKVNNTNVTSSVSNNQYTVRNIQSNTTVEVEFEAIPPTNYTLSISSTGSGYASYDGTTIRSKTSTFTVNEGTNATISFSADNGYRIKSVKVNNSNVTSSVSNNKYTVSNIQRNTTVEVEFEAIPVTTYTLSIKATGNGSASYDGNTIRSKTSSFTVNEGTSAMITFNPDNGYRVKSVKVNSSDVTSNLSNNKYTISNINKNTTVEVEFQEELKTFTSDGLNYAVLSYDDKTVNLANGKYGTVLEVPATITYQDITWKVAGIDNAALANNEELAAIIWNPSAAFTVSVSNPNLLLYVKSSNYAPATIQNVVVNSTAESIDLTDAASGNNFYCPKEFTAKKISYTHNYGMITGLGESRGWETIALPFDVKKITHSSKGELTPFANWRSGDSKKPFWVMSYGASGWANASSIKANTPYIISMPNNPDYKAEFRLSGNITFSAENVTVKKSDNLQTGNYGGNTFTPNFSNSDNSGYLTLNVNNDYVSYSGGSAEGSTFVVNLRPVHPFEAYMTSTSKTRSTISINGDMATGIEDITQVLIDENKGLRIYNLKGQLIKVEQDKSLEEVRRSLPAGVYIVNGKKLIIK